MEHPQQLTDIALVGECSEASFGVALIGDTQSTERPQEFRVHAHSSITAHLRTDESKLTQHFTGGNKQKEDVGLVHQRAPTLYITRLIYMYKLPFLTYQLTVF